MFQKHFFVFTKHIKNAIGQKRFWMGRKGIQIEILVIWIDRYIVQVHIFEGVIFAF